MTPPTPPPELPPEVVKTIAHALARALVADIRREQAEADADTSSLRDDLDSHLTITR